MTMLQDGFLRSHDYLRVSVTDKCNLRCTYCMPPEGVSFLSHDAVLRNEEFLRLIGIFAGLGIRKVRFTGGEPLVRKGIRHILAEARAQFPQLELAITTNGLLLGDFLEDLHSWEVKKLNISLDTLNARRYGELTRCNSLEQVLQSIDRALDTDFFDIKINAVLFEETLTELDDFLAYAAKRNLVLRFIEKMPFSEMEQSHGFVSSDRLVAELEKRGSLVRQGKEDTYVAKRYDLLSKEGPVKLGIIPPMTHKFCKSCNRLRLTSDGFLKTCLHSSGEEDLRSALRRNESDKAIGEMVLQAVKRKQEGHTLDCFSSDSGCGAVANSRSMSKIGG